MRDFPNCFGENAVQIADSSSSSGKAAQNLVTCVYQTRLRGDFCLISITWSKSMMGQGLTVAIDDSTSQSLCKVDVKPWLFSKRKGAKSLEIDACKLFIYWDLSSAKFGSGPEPLGGFYLGIVFDKEMVLLLGDLMKEVYKKANVVFAPSGATFIAKREHVFGKRVYGTKGKFCVNGKIHDITIECDFFGLVDPCLVIRIDTKTVMQVKRLKWKFRGNQSIVVDGHNVEVYWDVHSWLFGAASGNAVFMFHTNLAAEKLWTSTDDTSAEPNSGIFCLPKSHTFRDSQLQDLGFSLILYAWKNE